MTTRAGRLHTRAQQPPVLAVRLKARFTAHRWWAPTLSPGDAETIVVPDGDLLVGYCVPSSADHDDRVRGRAPCLWPDVPSNQASRHARNGGSCGDSRPRGRRGGCVGRTSVASPQGQRRFSKH